MNRILYFVFVLQLADVYLPATVVGQHLISSEEQISLAWLQSALQTSHAGTHVLGELARASDWFMLARLTSARGVRKAQ
jgi:hypothetical protein